MFRNGVIFLVALTLVACVCSCIGRPPATQQAQSQGTEMLTPPESGSQAGQADNRSVVPEDVSSSQGPYREAEQLLRSGDFVGALIMLESAARSGPMDAELLNLLLNGHLGYTRKITMSRDVDPQILNEVLYSHYKRLLELDPENSEAAANLNGVMSWFENHGVTAPATVNPLAFLPGEVDSSGRSTGSR